MTPSFSLCKNSDFQKRLFRFQTTTMPMPSATFFSARNLMLLHYAHIYISFYESIYWNWVANTHLQQSESHKQAAFAFSFKNTYAYLLVQRSNSHKNIKLSENPRLLTYHVKIFAEGQNKTLITPSGIFQIICETRPQDLGPTVTHDKECRTPPLAERVPAVLQEERR